MPLAVDHVFICVENPQAAERALADFGLQFGRRRIHQGQGTANACVFFDNAYLELLWRHDDDELQSQVVRPVGLWERVRWRETGASPFGVAFRAEDAEIPIETWPYDAPFLPEGTNIPIVTPQFMWREPLIFLFVPRAPVTSPSGRQPPSEHRGKRRRLTRVTVCGPETPRLSPGLSMLRDLDVLGLKPAAEHHLELDWDGATSGEFHDFRPIVPLVLRW
jgi:hypothetical protein